MYTPNFRELIRNHGRTGVGPTVTGYTNVSPFFLFAYRNLFEFKHVFTSFLEDLKGGIPPFLPGGIPLKNLDNPINYLGVGEKVIIQGKLG